MNDFFDKFDSISIEAYHKHHAISKSNLDMINTSPYLYACQKGIEGYEEGGYQFTETKDMLLGSMFHCLVLEPENFDDTFVVAPKLNLARKADKQKYIEWCQQLTGIEIDPDAKKDDLNELLKLHSSKKIVDESMLYTAKKMAESVKQHPEISKLLSEGQPELSGFFKENKTGELCKVRPDFLSKTHILDLKKLSPKNNFNILTDDEIMKSIEFRRYHVQAALYSDGVEAITGKKLPFLFVFCQDSPPFITRCVKLDEKSIEYGREIYQKNLETYKECKEKGVWPYFENEQGVLEMGLRSLNFNKLKDRKKTFHEIKATHEGVTLNKLADDIEDVLANAIESDKGKGKSPSEYIHSVVEKVKDEGRAQYDYIADFQR